MVNPAQRPRSRTNGRLGDNQGQPDDDGDNSKQNRAKKDAAIVSAGCCCENRMLHA